MHCYSETVLYAMDSSNNSYNKLCRIHKLLSLIHSCGFPQPSVAVQVYSATKNIPELTRNQHKLHDREKHSVNKTVS